MKSGFPIEVRLRLSPLRRFIASSDMCFSTHCALSTSMQALTLEFASGRPIPYFVGMIIGSVKLNSQGIWIGQPKTAHLNMI